jgi:hypothetical protein
MRLESLSTTQKYINETNEVTKSETEDDRDKKLKNFRVKLDNEGLTDEEYAEYRGLCMFPFNRRGQELTKKFFLHTISPEEKQEWFFLKNKSYPIDADIIELEETTEEGNPNVKRIKMNTCGSLNFSNSENHDKIIWTNSLAGCFAVAIMIEYNDGSGTISLSHYQPMKIDENLEKIEEQTPKPINTKVKIKKALVLVAEECQQEPKSLKWKRSPKTEKLDAILRTIKRLIGNDASILVESYISSAHVGRERNHSLVIKKTPKGDLRYQTWYDNERPL